MNKRKKGITSFLSILIFFSFSVQGFAFTNETTLPSESLSSTESTSLTSVSITPEANASLGASQSMAQLDAASLPSNSIGEPANEQSDASSASIEEQSVSGVEDILPANEEVTFGLLPPLIESEQHIAKKGYKDFNKNCNQFYWEIALNAHNDGFYKHIKRGSRIIDTMGPGQIVDKNGIQVYYTEGSGEQTPIPPEHYSIINPEGNRHPTQFTTTFEITFHVEIVGIVEVVYNTIFDRDTAPIDPVSGKYIISNTAYFIGTDNDGNDFNVIAKAGIKTDPPTCEGSNDPSTTYLLIVKKDADTNAKIDGATFEIAAKDGTLIESNIQTTNGEKLVQIVPGEYIVREVSPPNGYRLSKINSQLVTIAKPEPGTETYKLVEFYNRIYNSYDLVIQKQDDKTGAALSGAEFDLLDGQGTLVKKIQVDSTGKATVLGLAAGNYSLVETKAPTGYILPGKNQAVPFTIKNNPSETTIQILVTNQQQASSSMVSSNTSSVTSSKPAVSSSTSQTVSSTSFVSSSNLPVSSQQPNPPPSSSTKAPVSSRSTNSSRSSSSSSSLSNRVILPVGTVSKTPSTPSGGTNNSNNFLSSSQEDATSLTPQREVRSGTIPLGGFKEQGAWSLLNLLMGLLSFICSIVLIICLIKRNKKGTSQKEQDLSEENSASNKKENPPLRVKRTPLRFLGILTGIIPGILFLLLENIRLPITWITRWTPLIGAFFIINMVALLLFNTVTKKLRKEEFEETD